jgi:NADPH:quinone reductase-like Zn-dependent oxidoreductase
MPTTSKAAVLPSAKAQIEIRDLDIPALKDNEILVKAKSIAFNPVDVRIHHMLVRRSATDTRTVVHPVLRNVHQHLPARARIRRQRRHCGQGQWPGLVEVQRWCVFLPPNATRFLSLQTLSDRSVLPRPTLIIEGDRVLGFAIAIGGFGNAHGAFQSYVILQAENTTRIPFSMSYNAAAALPMAVATAGLGVWTNLELPRPSTDSSSPTPTKSGEAVLVCGGSSSVGAAAVQMAIASGYEVYATASTAHSSWIRDLGAKQVFDRGQADLSEQITQAAERDGLRVVAAFDAVGTGEGEAHPAVMSAKILKASNGGGKIVTVRQWPDGVEKFEDVPVSNMMAFEVGVGQKELGTWMFNDWLESVLAKGTFKPGVELQVVEGGLDGVQKALDTLKKGVSGTKLLVELE